MTGPKYALTLLQFDYDRVGVVNLEKQFYARLLHPQKDGAKTTSQKAYVGVSLANVNFFNLLGMLVLHLDKSCVSIHIFLFCLSI